MLATDRLYVVILHLRSDETFYLYGSKMSGWIFRLTNGDIQKNHTFDDNRVVGANATGTSQVSAFVGTVIASR